jgi:CheY-like chemotaxis protein
MNSLLKKAILCVDDERMVLLSLRDQISRNFGDRYLYEFAESVEEAWEIIEEFAQDSIQILIIVSDWLMPGVKGDEFLTIIHQSFPQIVTVLLTGQADEAAIKRAYAEANLYCHISKPWDEATLIKVIKSGLDKFNE